MNDRTFPETSDFRRESTGNEVCLLVVKPSEIFGTPSDMIGSSTKNPQDKNLMPLTQKSWQVYWYKYTTVPRSAIYLFCTGLCFRKSACYVGEVLNS